MTHRAWTFSLVDRRNGQLVAMAVLCVTARYVSVAIPSVERIERRYPMPAQWAAIEAELAVGLAPAPLPKASVIRSLLAAETLLDVQYVHVLPVEVEGPEATAPVLDGLLRQQVRSDGSFDGIGDVRV